MIRRLVPYLALLLSLTAIFLASRRTHNDFYNEGYREGLEDGKGLEGCYDQVELNTEIQRHEGCLSLLKRHKIRIPFELGMDATSPVLVHAAQREAELGRRLDALAEKIKAQEQP